MIRPITFICALLFAASGLYLYQAKHRSQMVDRQIVSTMKAVDEARNRAVLLHAEYALLNDPQRLQDLAAQYLTLRPTEPTQFTSLADLPRRLPPVGAPPVEPPPVEPDAPMATAPAGTPDPTAPDPAGPAGDAAATAVASAMPPPPPMPPPAPPPAQIVRVASTRVAGTGAASSATGTPGASLIRPVALHPAPARGYVAPAPRPARPVATARYEPARVRENASSARIRDNTSLARIRDNTSNEAPPTTTAEAVRRIARGAPVDPTVPAVASALGMARSMMVAPSAIAPASAATLDRGRGQR